MPNRRRILCVTNHQSICDLVAVILADYEIVFARSKADALRKAPNGLYVLYLIYESLPDSTGLELATLLRHFDASTPILFLTRPRAIAESQASQVDAQGVISIDDLSDDLSRKVSSILAQDESGSS